MTIQRPNKIAASRSDFTARGMLEGTCYSTAYVELVGTCDLDGLNSAASSSRDTHIIEPHENDAMNTLSDTEQDDQLPLAGEGYHDEVEIVNGPRALTAVTLGQTPGVVFSIFICSASSPRLLYL